MTPRDLGTGAGDVAMLDHARARTAAVDLAHVRYESVTLDTLASRWRFDFVVGRYVLAHQPDGIRFLRQAAALVRPGGTLMFLEPAFPRLERHGLATAEQIGPDTLDERMRAEVSAARSQLQGASLACAWVSVA